MDKRKENGGHSTKTNGVDKRKNEYKNVLNDALTEEDLKDVIKMLLRRSIKKDDTGAAKILMEYYLGKPQASVDVTSNGGNINIPIIDFFETE